MRPNATSLNRLNMGFRMIFRLWIARTISKGQLTNASTSTDPSPTCTKASSSRQFTRDPSNSHKHDRAPWGHRVGLASTYPPWVPRFILWRIQTYCLWLMGSTMNNWYSLRIESQGIWAQFLRKFRTTSARFHTCAIQLEEKEVDIRKVLAGRTFFRWPDSSTWTRAWSEKIIN